MAGNNGGIQLPGPPIAALPQNVTVQTINEIHLVSLLAGRLCPNVSASPADRKAAIQHAIKLVAETILEINERKTLNKLLEELKREMIEIP